MHTTDIIILTLLVLLIVVLIILAAKNSKLAKENKVLKEILEVKDTTISNLQAQRVSVKDVIDNFASTDDVMARIHEGKSREEVSKELGIPLSKVELIIKFDKIKKEQLAK